MVDAQADINYESTDDADIITNIEGNWPPPCANLGPGLTNGKTQIDLKLDRLPWNNEIIFGITKEGTHGYLNEAVVGNRNANSVSRAD
jgi:hypothetical protein